MSDSAEQTKRPAMLTLCDDAWLAKQAQEFSQLTNPSLEQRKLADALLLEQERRQQGRP